MVLSLHVPSNPGWCKAVLALPVGGCSQNSIHPSFALNHNSGKLLMEMVPWCLLGAGKVCRVETRQPETAVEQRQVLGVGVTVLMIIGKNLLGSGETGWEETTQPKGAQLKKPWYMEERILMKSRGKRLLGKEKVWALGLVVGW